jgi:hypothetical protein
MTGLAGLFRCALAASLALGAAPALDAADIKPVPGVLITNTVYATISANGAGYGYMDTEDRFALVGVTPDELVNQIHMSAPGNKKLDATASQLRWYRHVQHQDLEQSNRMTLLYSSRDPEVYGGQTFAETSRKVLTTLKAGGETPFVFGPYAGLGPEVTAPSAPRSPPAASSGAPQVPDMGQLFNMLFGAARHYYRGILHRVEPADVPVSVLVNGEPVELPAVHAAGTFTFAQEPALKAEVWWLDNPDWPLTLHWVFGPASDLVTRIDFHSNSGTQVLGPALKGSPSVADGLAGKNCHVELHGIYFDSGSAVLLEESEPMLNEVAAAVKASPEAVLTIEGHTDNIGSSEYNQKLSEARANAVRDALVSRYGIAAGKLTAKGYGLIRPIETNATVQGRARNRRVELSRPCAAH